MDGVVYADKNRNGRQDQNNDLSYPWFFDVVPDPSHRAKPGNTDAGTDTGTDDSYIGGDTQGALAKTGASVLAVLLVAFGLGARVAGRARPLDHFKHPQLGEMCPTDLPDEGCSDSRR